MADAYGGNSLIARIDPNVWNFYKPKSGGLVVNAQPSQFLSSDRLDIISRYLLVKHMNLGWGVGWAVDNYRDLMFASNSSFLDGDGRKDSFASYMANFMDLIRLAQKGQFDYSSVVIPFSGSTIVDGAHRFSIALYHNMPISFVEVEGPQQKMDWHGLRSLGIKAVATEQLLQEFFRLNTRSYCAVFFNQEEGVLSQAKAAIADNATIVYEKVLFLTDIGKLNLMDLLYGHEPWWEDSKAAEFVRLRLKKSSKVNFVFFSPFNDEGSRPTKERVRKNLAADHCVHTNDTPVETSWIADIVLSSAGLKYLNSSPLRKPGRFTKFLKEYSSILQTRADREEFAIDSGSVMAAHGLRDCNDLDYISARGTNLDFNVKFAADISSHNAEYNYISNYSDKMIANPDFHFRWKGTKFLSLSSVLFLKSIRSSRKDLKDARSITSFGNRMGLLDYRDKVKMEAQIWVRDQLPILIARTSGKAKSNLPWPFYFLLRTVWRAFRSLASRVAR